MVSNFFCLTRQALERRKQATETGTTHLIEDTWLNNNLVLSQGVVFTALRGFYFVEYTTVAGGQHFLDCRSFSPGCPRLGALLFRQFSSCSPDQTPAAGGFRRDPRPLVGVCATLETEALTSTWHRGKITTIYSN